MTSETYPITSTMNKSCGLMFMSHCNRISKQKSKVGLIFAVVVFLFTCLLFISGCSPGMNGENKDFISNISFSHDSKKILFDRRKDDGPHMIQVYNLETGELSAYRSPPDEHWSMARYSPDGKKIVFTITPLGNNRLDFQHRQIAIMDPDGKNVRKITSSVGPKIYPSFSHSGKKVIYAKSGTVKYDAGTITVAGHFDIYETDIKTAKETRLTWFRFMQVTPPFFFPDDKSFIFSAEYFCSFHGVPDSDEKTLRRLREEYELKFKKNNIFLMRGDEKTLEPYILFFNHSSYPLPTAYGKQLFFEADGEPLSGGAGARFIFIPLMEGIAE